MGTDKTLRAVACDLDNTLFYSYKHRQENDVCLEWLDGKEQSFTPPVVYERLRTLTGNPGFIPVTTRSLAQLSRVRWPGPTPYLALAANGGILLRNGIVDAEYVKASRQSAAAAMPGLSSLLAEWEGTGSFQTLRMVDELYIFAHAPDKSEGELAAYAATCSSLPAASAASLTVQASGHKIYAFPPGISKGEGLDRLSQLEGVAVEWLAAGDSMIDLSMLSMADRALVPGKELAVCLSEEVNVKLCPAGCDFQEFVIDEACAWLDVLHR